MTVFLAEGEEIVRTYKCASVDLQSSNTGSDIISGLFGRRARTECTVTVTNKRVIYFAESEKPSRATKLPAIHTQEALIDKVSSMEFIQAESKMDLGPSFIVIILGLVICLMAIQGDSGVWFIPGVIALVMGFILMMSQVLSIKHLVLMRVSTDADPDGGIRASGMSRREEDSMAFYMVPTEDFERMSKEIGAIVLDIRTRGDDAVSRWKDRWRWTVPRSLQGRRSSADTSARPPTAS